MQDCSHGRKYLNSNFFYDKQVILKREARSPHQRGKLFLYQTYLPETYSKAPLERGWGVSSTMPLIAYPDWVFTK
jgi:hypothetical protein